MGKSLERHFEKFLTGKVAHPLGFLWQGRYHNGITWEEPVLSSFFISQHVISNLWKQDKNDDERRLRFGHVSVVVRRPTLVARIFVICGKVEDNISVGLGIDNIE